MFMWLEIVGSIVRWALTLGAGYFVRQHALTDAQADYAVSHLTEHIVIALVTMAPLVWSLVQKRLAELKLKAAIAAPAVSEKVGA
jgi:membrane protein DedA with SNARE-associated domain